jgi:hypothetical protein
MSPLSIPILRHGKVYESLDKTQLTDIRTEVVVAQVSQANAGMIRRDSRNASRDLLRQIPTEKLIHICQEAGRLFMEEDLPLGGGTSQSPQSYVECLSATTGMPHALVRRNMQKIHQVFTQMNTILRGLTRGLEWRVLDQGMGEQAGVPVSFFCVADSLGVVLPSNSPGVNSLWMPSIPLKVPVVLKPGREEPWTPLRIIQAFIAAGCPPEAFSFYPTDHEGSAAVMETSPRALIFGDQSTVERYASNPGVQVHGPGWSKVIIGSDQIARWRDYLDVLVSSIVDNGGRSCINASAILVPSEADAIAEALAQRLAAITPLPYDHPQAILAGFANPKVAEAIDATIEEGLKTAGAEEVTAKYRKGTRLAQMDGSTYLQPTLIRCRDFRHPLANREFLFPYASLIEMPQEKMLEEMGSSLVVTAITEDRDLIQKLIASPRIDRLNIGPMPTSRVQWDQPHEGNLFEFLYRRRAIQRAALS